MSWCHTAYSRDEHLYNVRIHGCFRESLSHPAVHLQYKQKISKSKALIPAATTAVFSLSLHSAYCQWWRRVSQLPTINVKRWIHLPRRFPHFNVDGVFRICVAAPQSDVEAGDDAAIQEHQSQQTNQNPPELMKLKTRRWTRRRRTRWRRRFKCVGSFLLTWQ